MPFDESVFVTEMKSLMNQIQSVADARIAIRDRHIEDLKVEIVKLKRENIRLSSQLLRERQEHV